MLLIVIQIANVKLSITDDYRNKLELFLSKVGSVLQLDLPPPLVRFYQYTILTYEVMEIYYNVLTSQTSIKFLFDSYSLVKRAGRRTSNVEIESAIPFHSIQIIVLYYSCHFLGG
jgi:hypothetical protein